MKELSARKVIIKDSYWTPRQEINATQAIFHQWEELEKSGCINNFRIVSGEMEGFREGWFFADSDAYKWLDAAARIYSISPDPKLKNYMDGLIQLIAHTQMEDGYINTYNQYHFPGQRWINLQVEHELYCLGHLIEAGVSHYEATSEDNALKIATRAANLLVDTFLDGPPDGTDGHQEIEIALMRLYMLTGENKYLDLAQHFIEMRGRIRFFGLVIQRQNSSSETRKVYINQKRREYAVTHPEYAVSKIPPDNESKIPPFSKLRRNLNAFRGFYTQQYTPIRKATIPVGHSVRFGYFQTAITMLYRLRGDASLLPTLEQSWEHMITKRMYVTGGLGSLPGNEGFGFDYELDAEYAYNETCAALASLFWNWEMALTTREAKYSDLFEWQLYNAAATGMGLDGKTYLYNNPLCVRGGITRRSWYSVPCCPPNLSRTWAYLGRYIYSFDDQNFWIHQYIGNEIYPNTDFPFGIRIESELPFNGSVTIRLNLEISKKFCLNLRIPSWCAPSPILEIGQPTLPKTGFKLTINGSPSPISQIPEQKQYLESTAQGYDPRTSFFLPILRTWNPGDIVNLLFEMPVTQRHAHPKVKHHTGKVTITKGPLVYCLESNDNQDVDIFKVRLDPDTLLPEIEDATLGKITILMGKSTTGQSLKFIPYHLWGNRGTSQMNVWIYAKSGE